MDFRTMWGTFRKTPFFRLVYLVLVALLSTLLLLSVPLGLACLSFLLVPVVMLLIPYTFGERKMRNHAMNGFFMILTIPIVYALITTPNLVSLPQVAQGNSDGGVTFAGGFVTPFDGSAATEFNFTVNVTTSRPEAPSLRVRLQLFDYEGLGETQRFVAMIRDPRGNGSLVDGETYYANVALAPTLHLFNFQVLNASGTVVAQTFGSWGPFNAPYDAILGTVWLRAYPAMVILGAGFYLILLLYWWTRKARDMRGARRPLEKKRAEGGGEFTCTNCGADVTEEATKCANCGAVFEAEAEGEPAEGKA